MFEHYRAHGERTTLRQRKFKKDLLVTPREHIVTVYENMYSVLAGRTNIADFINWLLISVETAMYEDGLDALTTGLASIPAGTLNYTGAFDIKTLVEMCERVQIENGGVRPIIVGGAAALTEVLPDATSGYRMNIDGSDARINLVKSVIGYDVLRLDNARKLDGSMYLDPNKIYVICPSVDKLVKGVMTNALSNGNEFYQNSDLTKDFTYRKEWEFVYSSAAKAGVYNIT